MSEFGHVTVMRSYDYCHFEFSLPLPDQNHEEQREVYLQRCDFVRKDAARLADKAIKQYIIAKENAEMILSDTYTRECLVKTMQAVEKIPEGERTVDQQAQLKAFKDEPYKGRRRYDYEDDWRDEEYQDDE